MQASTFDGSRAAFPVQSMGPCTAAPTPSPPPAPRDADIGCSVLVPRPKEKAPPSAPPPLPTSRTYGAPDLVPRTLAGASTSAASYTGNRHTPRPSQSAIAARLAAAKPVVWKGQGELLQLPWPAEAKGFWLVVDLWSGCGGLIFALLSLGVRFIALCAERDECASACSRTAFPNFVHTTRVEDVTADLFDNVAARRTSRASSSAAAPPTRATPSWTLVRSTPSMTHAASTTTWRGFGICSTGLTYLC